MCQKIIIFIIFIFINSSIFAQNSNQNIEVIEIEGLYERSVLIKKEQDTLAHLYYESELCHFSPFLDIDIKNLDSAKKETISKEVCNYLLNNGYKHVMQSNNYYLKWIYSFTENINYQKQDSLIAFQTHFEKINTKRTIQLDKVFWIKENRIYIYKKLDDLYIKPNSIIDEDILYYVSDCVWNENGIKLRHTRIKKVLSSKTYIVIYEMDGNVYVINKNTAILTKLKHENIDKLKLENNKIIVIRAERKTFAVVGV